MERSQRKIQRKDELTWPAHRCSHTGTHMFARTCLITYLSIKRYQFTGRDMLLQKSSRAAEFAKTTATSIDFACITQEAQHVDTNTKLGCVLPTLQRNIYIHCQFLILLRQALLRLLGLRDITLQWTGYGIFGNSKRDIPRYRTSDTFTGEKAAALWKKYSQTSGWDHLSSEASFPKYQKFPGQITIFGTSCKQPPLVSDGDHFF